MSFSTTSKFLKALAYVVLVIGIVAFIYILSISSDLKVSDVAIDGYADAVVFGSIAILATLTFSTAILFGILYGIGKILEGFSVLSDLAVAPSKNEIPTETNHTQVIAQEVPGMKELEKLESQITFRR